ncbi:MAG: LysM peptidoglycan-binding domain-containing protein [Gemmatimonadota bacterium]|nr:LysM peptidoglycan-binding domain-containing protein [Gemmatimonadota bacterium]
MDANPGSSNADFNDVNASSGSDGKASNSAADFSDVTGGASSTSEAMETYTVKSGDNLRRIAQHFYGDEMKWHKIRDANRDKLPNPDKIQEGMTLNIPKA